MPFFFIYILLVCTELLCLHSGLITIVNKGNVMNRNEHLDWAQQRCYEYLNNGDLQQAIRSFVSDMSKHDELKDHIGLKLLSMHSGNIIEFKKFVDGFN